MDGGIWRPVSSRKMRSIAVSGRRGFRWCIQHFPRDDTPKAQEARNVTGCLGSGKGTAFDRLTLLCASSFLALA